mgnify:FL=1|jgi:hypothetical protein
MKSKIIKAVGKEIVSLLFIILSIIGVLCIGHFLYSISNMLVWIVLGILFLGYISSVVYSCIDAPAVSYWYIVYYHSRGQASLFLPKEDDFFNVEYYRNLIEKEAGYRVMILDWKEFTEEQYQLILKEYEREQSNGIAKAE